MVNTMVKNISRSYYDIVIKGAYGASNFGDDALLFSLIQSLPKSKSIAVIGKKNNYINKHFKNIHYYTYSDEVKIQCGVLIWGGGTQFYSFKSFKLLFYKFMNIKSTPRILINKLKLGYRGVQVNFKREIYLSIGFGPFSSTSKESLAGNRISKAQSVYIRDDLSYTSLKQYVTSEKIHRTEDICLLDFARYKNKNKNKNKRVAIIIRDWKYNSNSLHIKKTIEFYQKFHKKIDMDFILFADDKVCIKALNSKNIPYLQWDPTKLNILDFSNMLSCYERIVSSRYHGIIFSLIHSIPSVAINIEPKLSQVSSEYSESVKLWQPPYSTKDLYKILMESTDNKVNKLTFITPKNNSHSLYELLLKDVL